MAKLYCDHTGTQTTPLPSTEECIAHFMQYCGQEKCVNSPNPEHAPVLTDYFLELGKRITENYAQTRKIFIQIIPHVIERIENWRSGNPDRMGSLNNPKDLQFSDLDDCVVQKLRDADFPSARHFFLHFKFGLYSTCMHYAKTWHEDAQAANNALLRDLDDLLKERNALFEQTKGALSPLEGGSLRILVAGFATGVQYKINRLLNMFEVHAQQFRNPLPEVVFRELQEGDVEIVDTATTMQIFAFRLIERQLTNRQASPSGIDERWQHAGCQFYNPAYHWISTDSETGRHRLEYTESLFREIPEIASTLDATFCNARGLSMEWLDGMLEDACEGYVYPNIDTIASLPPYEPSPNEIGQLTAEWTAVSVKIGDKTYDIDQVAVDWLKRQEQSATGKHRRRRGGRRRRQEKGS